MWQRCFYLCLAAISSRSLPVYAADVYQTLTEDAKKLQRPSYNIGPDFKSISKIHTDDSLLGLDSSLVKTPEQKFEIQKLFDIVGESSFANSILKAATSQIDHVDEDRHDDQGEGQTDASEDDADGVESLGIISVLRSNVEESITSIPRGHTKQIITFPVFQSDTWREMRAEKSIETQSGDHLADRNMTDFCTEDAGLGLPSSAHLKFSIFDIGIAETSSSSFDLALLHLLEQPDAFRIAAAVDENKEDDIEGQRAWQEILSEWQQSLKSAKRKLTDIATLEQTKASPFATALSELTKVWSQRCVKSGGRWIENQNLRKAKAEWTIAECQMPTQGPLFRIFTNDSSIDNATALTFSVRQGNWVAITELQDIADGDIAIKFWLKTADDGNRVSALLSFDEDGRMRQRIGSKSSLTHLAWDKNRQLIWSGRQYPDGRWIEDITWDASGKPQTKFYFDEAGNVKSIVEWYRDYRPASISHFANGRREGLQQWWHESGRLAGDSMWSYGKRLGTSHLQFEQGIVGFDASYIDNQLDGSMIWRDETGHEIMRAKFNQGLVEGTVSLKSDPKTELALAKFDHGLAEGEVRFGQPGQQPTITFPFKSGILDGVVTFYTRKHTVRMQVPFQSGRLDGELKTFYSDGTKAAACKFDNGHLLNWNSWPKNKDPSTLRIEGRLNDAKSTGMSQTIHDDAKRIAATCDGIDGEWHHCVFSVKGKNYSLSDDDINAATQFVAVNGHPYNIKKCPATKIWNLNPWIETGAVSSLLELVPSPGCKDSVTVRCQIAFTNRLQINGCSKIEDAVEDDHDHDHD